MSNVITLDSIRESVAKKYASVKVDLGTDTVELKQVLRLGKDARKTVIAKIEELEKVQELEDGTDEMLSIAREVVLSLAEGDRFRLEAAVGGDSLVYLELFNSWMEASQPGEAESSPA